MFVEIHHILVILEGDIPSTDRRFAPSALRTVDMLLKELQDGPEPGEGPE